MDLERESERWVAAGIVDAGQRQRILDLYGREGRPAVADDPTEVGGGPSLAVLAILWTGGALVFLGVAFLLGIVWNDLGPLRPIVVLGIDVAFAAAGLAVRGSLPGLEKTGMALLVIAGLLLPPAIGVAWEDLFGAHDDLMPLIVFAFVVYTTATLALRSRAFAVLGCAALFSIGCDVVGDADRWGALFPLVQLGLVSSLRDVYPVVFLTLAGGVVGLSFLCRKDAHLARLEGTLFTCALLLGLGPANVAPLDRYRDRALLTTLALVASIGGMGLAVAQRQRRAFWVAGASLIIGLLILFGNVFDNSIGVVAVAIVVGLAVMAAGSYLAVAKDTWVDRLFGEGEGAAPKDPPALAPASAPRAPAPAPDAPPPTASEPPASTGQGPPPG